jgi:ComF family protein
MFLRGLEELARGFADLLLPNSCLVCDSPQCDRAAFRHGLCPACYSAVTHDPHEVCPRCAATVGPYTDVTNGCLSCRSARFAFKSAFRLGPYTGRLREAILRMKSERGEALAEQIGFVVRDALLPRISGQGISLVSPMPLHWLRRWTRGHNQVEPAARELAAGLGVPCDPHLLRRKWHNPQHTQRSAAARRRNVAGVFSLKRNARLTGQTVLLVDDVMTTGSTATEAARVLRRAGAARVVVVVLARN